MLAAQISEGHHGLVTRIAAVGQRDHAAERARVLAVADGTSRLGCTRHRAQRQRRHGDGGDATHRGPRHPARRAFGFERAGNCGRGGIGRVARMGEKIADRPLRRNDFLQAPLPIGRRMPAPSRAERVQSGAPASPQAIARAGRPLRAFRKRRVFLPRAQCGGQALARFFPGALPAETARARTRAVAVPATHPRPEPHPAWRRPPRADSGIRSNCAFGSKSCSCLSMSLKAP